MKKSAALQRTTKGTHFRFHKYWYDVRWIYIYIFSLHTACSDNSIYLHVSCCWQSRQQRISEPLLMLLACPNRNKKQVQIEKAKKLEDYIIQLWSSLSRWAAQHPPRRLTVEQHLCWSDCMGTGRAAHIDAKTNFRFGNIVPKQWILSGLLQHTTANSMCKYNKTSQQHKVLYMNKLLQRVTHFQTILSVGIQPVCFMAKLAGKHTLPTPFSID